MQRQIPLYQKFLSTVMHVSSTPPTKHKVKGGQFLGCKPEVHQLRPKHRCPLKKPCTLLLHPQFPTPCRLIRHFIIQPPFTQGPFPKKRPFHMFSPTLTIKSAPRPINRDSHRHRHAIMARLTLPHSRTPKCHCTAETFLRIYDGLFN